MITVTDLEHDHATDSGSENLGDQTTGTISPTNGSLVLIAVGANKPSSVPTTPTVSGLSMTWTQIATRTLGGVDHRITLFRGLANGNSGTLTISHGGENQQNIYWAISEINRIDSGGTNGSNAIVQSAGNNGSTTTTFTVTLGAFDNAKNGTLGVVYNTTSESPSVGSGFTEVATSDGAHKISTEFKTENDTSVDWSTTGNANYVALAVELKIKPFAARIITI